MGQKNFPGAGGRGIASLVAFKRTREVPPVSSSPRALQTRLGFPFIKSIVRACSGETVEPREALTSTMHLVTRVLRKVRAAGVSRKSTCCEVEVTRPGPRARRKTDTTSDSARAGVVTMGVAARLLAWEEPISYSSSSPSSCDWEPSWEVAPPPPLPPPPPPPPLPPPPPPLPPLPPPPPPLTTRFKGSGR